MTAELATLERKVDAVLAKVDIALAQIGQISRIGHRGLTQVEFAKLIKVHPRTVQRMIDDKRIRLEKGRVPWAQAEKFLS